MRKGLVVILAVAMVMVWGASAFATNGYQLIGIGQLQKSMGGAVTAAPRDSMTAISNPAGMSRVGSRADFSMEAFMPVRSVDFTGGGMTGGQKTEGGTDMYGIPAIGWTAPAFDRDDMYFGGGMYGTSGLGVDYGEILMMKGANLDGYLAASLEPACATGCEDMTFNGFSAVQFWKMAPTVAWDINDDASIGFALNIDYQSVAIAMSITNVPFYDNPMAPTATVQDDINFDLGRPTSQIGFGFTVGGLYDIGDMVTVGAMYSSKQTFAESEYQLSGGDLYNYAGAVGLPGTYKLDLDYPAQAAIGVAVKPMDNLLIALDVKQIYWSGTHDKVKLSGPAGAFNTMSGPANSVDLNFGWEDQTVYALGVVYGVNQNLDISAGYNQSDAPIDEKDVFNNLVFPAVVEKHYTAGFDYRFGSHWGLGMTYMKAVSEKLEGKDDNTAMQMVSPMPTSSGTVISLEEDSYGMQLSYRF